ncbi:MAG: cytochrome c biogenesis CcdA family protein [Acidimicrobiales bacterium]
MIDVDVLLAFTTGMAVTVNPCGFAMLPSYLLYFLGADGEDADTLVGVTLGRALVVGLAVTVGFVATFAVVGVAVNSLTHGIYDVAPWVTVVIGAALVGVGIAFLLGFSPTVVSPHLERGGRTRGVGSMALFGVSYAVASIGCTLPLFLTFMVGNFGRGLAAGSVFFAAYAAGFGLVITALTVTLALGRRSLAIGLRSVLPYVNRVAGLLLIVAGAYVAYYGTIEIRGARAAANDGITSRVADWSASMQSWINDTGGDRIGLVLGLVVLGALIGIVTYRRRIETRA